MIIYSMKLPQGKNEIEFEAFMLTEIFPSVDKSWMRGSRIMGLVLLKGSEIGRSHEYVWLVQGSSSGSLLAEQIERIEAFGAEVSPMQEFTEIGNWFAAHSQRVCA